MSELRIDTILADFTSSDYEPPNPTCKVQITGIEPGSKAVVDVRVRLDASLDYITKFTFRAGILMAESFDAFPFMEFVVRKNVPGNQIKVFVD